MLTRTLSSVEDASEVRLWALRIKHSSRQRGPSAQLKTPPRCVSEHGIFKASSYLAREKAIFYTFTGKNARHHKLYNFNKNVLMLAKRKSFRPHLKYGNGNSRLVRN